MPASYLQEQLPGPLGYLLVTSAPRSGITLGRSQGTQEGQSPNARSPRDLHQQHHAHPPQPTALHEVFVGGAHRIPVDALGPNLLPVSSLQRLIDAYDQRAFRHKRLHQQPQQYATHLPTRPASAAKYPVVAMEALLLV